jgi:hypothetical protein
VAEAGGPGPHVKAHRWFMVFARILACRWDSWATPAPSPPQTTVTEQRAAERERASALGVCSAFGACCTPLTGGTMDSISRIWANRRRKIQNPKSKIAKIDRRGGPLTSRNRHQHAPCRRPTACLDDDSNWASKRREFQCGSASSLPTQRHVRTACPFLWALREGVSASSAATTSNR